ncbi:hypothetical protein B0H19DRAFT_1060013 [Mycena capillaripes]|nr:hypothetical protein B0H19DRAFT_1060013 [Mycena capillaripes]
MPGVQDDDGEALNGGARALYLSLAHFQTPQRALIFVRESHPHSPHARSAQQEQIATDSDDRERVAEPPPPHSSVIEAPRMLAPNTHSRQGAMQISSSKRPRRSLSHTHSERTPERDAESDNTSNNTDDAKPLQTRVPLSPNLINGTSTSRTPLRAKLNRAPQMPSSRTFKVRPHSSLQTTPPPCASPSPPVLALQAGFPMLALLLARQLPLVLLAARKCRSPGVHPHNSLRATPKSDFTRAPSSPSSGYPRRPPSCTRSSVPPRLVNPHDIRADMGVARPRSAAGRRGDHHPKTWYHRIRR